MAKRKREAFVLAVLRRKVTMALRAEPKKYELTLANNGRDDVVGVLTAVYERHRHIMPIEQAAMMVEAHYHKQAKQVAAALQDLSSMRRRMMKLYRADYERAVRGKR
jgi:hypothetical protein